MVQKNVPFEEALTMTGFGRYNVIEMILVSMLVIGMAVETTSVAYLVPASACELQTTPVQQGLMAGTPLFGILLASNIWGYYGDTRGRRKMLIVAMVMGFVSGCAATFSPNWIVFSFLKFVSCAAMAGTFGLGSALLSECTPSAHRFKLMILMTSIFSGSLGAMAVLTIPVLSLKFSYYIPYLDIHFNSWRVLNIIYSLTCAIGAIASYFTLESPKYLLSVGRYNEAMEILRTMYVMNSGKDGKYYEVFSVTLDEDNVSASSVGVWRSVINQTLPLFKPALLRHTLLLSTLYIAGYFCVSPFTVWVPFIIDGFMKSLAKGETGLSFCQMLMSSQNQTSTIEDDKPNDCTFDPTAMLLVFAMYMILSVMNIVISLLLPYIGRKTMFIGIQAIVSLAAFSVNSSSTWMLTAILVVVYVHGMLNFGLLNTFSVDLFPTYVKAMGVCLTLMVGRGSAVLGINLLKNLLTTSLHCDITFYVFGSISFAGGLLAFLLPSDTKQKEESTSR